MQLLRPFRHSTLSRVTLCVLLPAFAHMSCRPANAAPPNEPLSRGTSTVDLQKIVAEQNRQIAELRAQTEALGQMFAAQAAMAGKSAQEVKDSGKAALEELAKGDFGAAGAKFKAFHEDCVKLGNIGRDIPQAEVLSLVANAKKQGEALAAEVEGAKKAFLNATAKEKDRLKFKAVEVLKTAEGKIDLVRDGFKKFVDEKTFKDLEDRLKNDVSGWIGELGTYASNDYWTSGMITCFPALVPGGVSAEIKKLAESDFAHQAANQAAAAALNQAMMMAMSSGNPYVIAAVVILMILFALFGGKGSGGGGKGNGKGKGKGTGVGDATDAEEGGGDRPVPPKKSPIEFTNGEYELSGDWGATQSLKTKGGEAVTFTDGSEVLINFTQVKDKSTEKPLVWPTEKIPLKVGNAEKAGWYFSFPQKVGADEKTVYITYDAAGDIWWANSGGAPQ